MRRAFPLFLLLLLPALAVSIREVKVEGAGPVLATLAEIALPVRAGDEIDPDALPRLAEAVRETGYFESVEVALKDGVLLVRVKPNPKIAEVRIEARAFAPEKLAAYLADQLALAPGTTYNPKKAEKARELLAELYRRQGFPFTPEVKLAVERKEDGVHLAFEVVEEVPLTGLRIHGAHWVPEEAIKTAFTPLVQGGKFVWERYLEAVRQVGALYAERGYRGSGVDPERTRLVEGVLELYLRELRVRAVDPDGLPYAPIKVGDPFNYDRLVEAVAELTRELGREVRFSAEPEKDGVRIRFELGERTYGPIQAIRIEGATAFPEEELKAQLVQKVGDPFSPQLAQADFERLVAYYQKAGYALVLKPDYRFEDGTYVIRLREVRIAGYRLQWKGGHRTQDFVILREFPKPGALFSVPAIREGIGKLLRLGILAGPPGVRTAPGPSEDQVVVELELEEAKTVVIAPAVAWSSQSGWSGQVSLSDKNLWGRAHNASLNLSFVENDAGDNLSFSLSYQIPWLYLDLFDFKETPTSVNFAAYSIPYGNFKLKDGETETGWEYTERRSGLSFSVSRPLTEEITLAAGLEGQWVETKLETLNPPESSDYDEAAARALLPGNYANALATTTFTYSDADDPFYPTTGRVATVHGGYGLVFPEGEPAQGFAPLWASYKTYAAQDPEGRSVFAVRAVVGAILGAPPESRYFSLGGSEPEISMLRGYQPRSFSGTRLFAGSLEYRYDFRFESVLTRTVIGIVFADLGSVWFPGDDPELHAGFGVGVQLNLGYGAVQFPAIRLDYGFSSANPGGVLHFRIGPVF